MKNFWHFGDSFAFNDFSKEINGYKATEQIRNYGDIISSELNLKYRFHAQTGDSNELIFHDIILKNDDFKKGDIIFVNWSFFSRSIYIDFYKNNDDDIFHIKSTNEWFDDDRLRYTNSYDKINKYKEEYSFIMNYILNYNFDLTFKLFNNIVAPFFQTLLKREIKIYNLFIHDSDKLNYGSNIVDWKVESINMGNFIKFEPDYYIWLKNNNLLREQEGHYTEGIQQYLAEEIKKRMNLKNII